LDASDNYVSAVSYGPFTGWSVLEYE
jgi:hypothetical protein